MRADVVVLGAGPGGIACARRSAQLGAQVVLVDPGEWHLSPAFQSVLPQKLLAGLIADAGSGGAGPGVWRRFCEQREATVGQTVEALERELNDAGVRRVRARGTVAAVGPEVTVATPAATVVADRLVLAVGAGPAGPALGGPHWCGPGTPVLPAERLYMADLDLPERLVIIGGGYVGVTAAACFAALGVEVVLTLEDELPLAGFDEELGAYVAGELARLGVRLRPETRVEAVVAGEQRHAVETTAGVFAAELVVLADGGARRARTDGLGLDAHGIARTPMGAVYVDTRYTTRVAGVHAVGDCADHAGHGLDPASFDLGPVAEAEGTRLADHLFGTAPPALDYDRIALAVEAPLAFGATGLGTARAAALGFDVAGDGRPQAPCAAGFVKLVRDRRSDEVLGCHLAGPGASEAVRAVAELLATDAAAAGVAAALAERGDVPLALREELVAQARGVG